MMRSLWIALSTLALANLMALGIAALWLNSTGRLSKDRVEQVRLLFAQTVAQDKAKEAQAKAEADLAAKQAAEKAREKKPPITAEQRLEIIREYEETQRQKNERLQRETKDLLNQLEIRRNDFENERKKFIADKTASEKQWSEREATVSSEQFAKTLKVYESVKAADAASMMGTLLAAGESGRTQVVAYLNQMQPRTSSRIIGEFQKQDPALAADLLERLRTYGLVAKAPNPDLKATPDAAPPGATPPASSTGLPPAEGGGSGTP